MNRKGVLAIISGFSGVGKGTVVRELIKKYPYALSVSATTRQPREGEVPGVSYHFLTKEEFMTRIEKNDFLEWAQYVENYYGTPKSFVLEQLEQGQDVILEIEAKGAFKVQEQYPEVMMIYMVPPTMAELKRRLIGRGTEKPEVIAERLSKAVEEIAEARKYDFLVVNDELEACIEETHRVIQTRTGINPATDPLLDRLEKEAKEMNL